MGGLRNLKKIGVLQLLFAIILAGLLASGAIYISGAIFNLTLLVSSLIGVGVSVLVAIAISVIITNYYVKPAKKLYGFMQTLLEGQFDQRVGGLPKSFVGLGETLNELAAQLQGFLHQSQTEAQVLSQQNLRISSVFNTIHEGIIALDKQRNIMFFNAAASKLSGFELAEVAGKPIDELIPIKVEDELIIGSWIHSCLEKITAENSWEDAYITTKSGQDKMVTVHTYYSKVDPSGIEAVIMLSDKSAEQELEDMKLDFVALAAHELRTPVTIIKGYIETLQDELKQNLTEGQVEYFAKLEFASSQLTGYINNILNVARIERGQLNYKFERTNWSEVVKMVCEELAKKAAVRNRKLRLQLPENLPDVAVDRVSIVEVINNLVDNAIKYSHLRGEIIVRVELVNDQVQTTVQDFGVGIPNQLMGKLFTKFYRSHRTNTTHRGTGLGLYMSRSIVEAHHGSIWVKSKEGEGSTFGFNLPTYDQIADKIDAEENDNITRGIHGWIKNHSLYRR